MGKLSPFLKSTLITAAAMALLVGCSRAPGPIQTPPSTPIPGPITHTPGPTPDPLQPNPTAPPDTGTDNNPGNDKPRPGVTVAAKPADIAVLVNKAVMLPSSYKPADLVEPKVAFIFAEKSDKRLMRQEAAKALEQMFAGAKTGGINLAGVSGFRSYETQKNLFNYYVQAHGEAAARRFSAEPGFSEHQTGLAMDISGTNGKCAADDCFDNTPEANWLAAHASEYGFIIRYPKGKEGITGYIYEPWHVRYLGKALAQKVAASGLTYEEYLGKAH